MRAPGVTVLFDPRVQRGLRFFEQRDLFEARGQCRFYREIARAGVERRWHGEHYFLLGEITIGRARRAKGFVQMIEQAKRGFDWRDLLDVLGRVERQRPGTTVDTAIREPALGARNHALRSLCTA